MLFLRYYSIRRDHELIYVLVGKGRGRQVIAVARTADVVIMMLDATKGDVQRCVLPTLSLLGVHVLTIN